MLRELYVENFALIENIRLNLSQGLTALSGETGAGKSLIIDAVALLIGGKAGDSYIREGSDKCYVEGIFSPPYPEELQEISDGGFLFTADEDIIISREYGRNGKNSCRINSRSVTMQQLKQIGRLLINIHGQMEHMLLLEEEKQLQLLDSFAGETLLLKKEEVRQAFDLMKKFQNEVRSFEENKDSLNKRMADLKYQIDDIKNASLRIGEDEELAEEKIRLINSDKLFKLSSASFKFLADNGAARDKISQAVNSFKEVSAIDEKTALIFERLTEVYFSLEDIINDIGEYSHNIQEDPARLEEIENRIFFINSLKKKYGKDITQILDYLIYAQDELAKLEDTDYNCVNAQERLQAAENDYLSKATELGLYRKEASLRLAERISAELKFLYMPNSDFKVDLIDSTPAAQGMEKALFLIKSNTGEKFQPVSKIASGGELSRIVLAIKVVLAELEQVPTLIFDEVDSGLGGKALSAVAKRMAMVGEYTQSLCVTHAPLMAAAASNHIYIYKEIRNGRTVILFNDLNYEGRVHELARMIAGDSISETTLAQAKEMLN